MKTAMLFPETEIQEKPRQHYESMQVVRIALVKERPLLYEGQRLTAPNQIRAAFQELLGDADREYFLAFMLDGKNRISSCNVVSVGSLNQAIVHPREVFKAAILSNAAAIIVAHNHPSGDTSPSREDREITRRLKEAGDMIGIRVLDHIILGESGYLSFTEQGLL